MPNQVHIVQLADSLRRTPLHEAKGRAFLPTDGIFTYREQPFDPDLCDVIAKFALA